MKALRRILGNRVDSSTFARAADLLTKAATSAPFEGRPMYAALRAIPIPDDVVARLFHAASLLREHRGDGHIAALMVEGVGGLEAHVLLALAMDMPPEIANCVVQNSGATHRAASDASDRAFAVAIVEHMVDRATRAASVRFDIVPAAHPDALGSMSMYFAELNQRFVGGFETGDALTADADAMTAPTGAFIVAYGHDHPIACGGLLRIDDRTAEIKRMWIDPEWRGLGNGRRMLSNLEAQAAHLGYARVRLDTNGVLVEAIAMYERSGYDSIDRYNDNPYAQRWFEKQLSVG